jgi:hypothetical protein
MRKSLSGDTRELMGLFGFSWEEKTASFMNKKLKGTQLAKKLKTFWQAGGMNVSIVKNLHREYTALQATGWKPANFSALPDAKGDGGTFDNSTVQLAGQLQARTNIESPIVFEFLRALFTLARDGNIPFQKWNPQGYKQSTLLQKTFATERSGFLDAAKSTGGYMKIVLAIAAVGVSAYLLSQIKVLKGSDNEKKV